MHPKKIGLNLRASFDSVTFENIEEHKEGGMNLVKTIITQKHTGKHSHKFPNVSKTVGIREDFEQKLLNMDSNKNEEQLEESEELNQKFSINDSESSGELVVETYEEVQYMSN